MCDMSGIVYTESLYNFLTEITINEITSCLKVLMTHPCLFQYIYQLHSTKRQVFVLANLVFKNHK